MEARGLAYKDVTFLSADGRSEVNGWWIPAPAPDGPAPEGTATLAAALPKTASDPAAASATVPVSDNVAAASTAAMASQPASDDSAAAASNLFSGRTVILSHGYGTNREESWVPMYDIAALLHGLDYNVLMFDYGYADSRNRAPATGGVYESGQLLGALKFAREQGSREVVVWGFSMGAGTALQAALRTDLIDGMILDSAFIPDADSIYSNIRRYASLPKRLSLELIRAIVPMFAGTRLEQIPSAEAQSTAFAFPVLVIHGSADDKAPASISENVAAAQTNPLSELWSVPDAMHEMIFRTHPEEYVRRTTGFLQAISENVEARQDASSTITA
ncbi:alpha/beta fold hydrolase [Cohnella xylanilytica]|uniref:Alpha/beta fold hydrolase n=2 Tax=Cohnella xylanilytica TaxID=557555 RepID=A0A841U202_9BACL|nr:alpha/beta fold hydrolase [Cohnella xylanilytica]